MAPLKIGYLLPTRDQAVRGDHDPDQLIDQARRAEALGFDSVWAGDSPVTTPRADPLLLLAAVAVATRRITLGTAVLLPALRHPILLAHQLATLDRLADGRLIVGMGGGFPNAGRVLPLIRTEGISMTMSSGESRDLLRRDRGEDPVVAQQGP
ncbi:LLM class flavin-dependent oxidoreductase, partial [Streptosporangium canum]|uniref:LLM class flavin-dependent oxidoreductase n=1 Tax=Streptosporangium canum TaxID=324952 RepID=UPI0037A78F26